MKTITVLKNVIQPYAWGSHTAIAKLLGQTTPSARPQAELWMGAHPKAPSQVRMDGRWQALDAVISAHAGDILGSKSVQAFGTRLPYLFKVLAAKAPLSIQAHPDAAQAAAGFERENRLSIPLDAPQRNYKDDQHKPELLCALESFWALCGFCPADRIRTYLEAVQSRGLQRALAKLGSGAGGGDYRSFFKTLMEMPAAEKSEALAAMRNAVPNAAAADDPAFKWFRRLYRAYPPTTAEKADIGVLAPFFLNLIRLPPGEAIFLPAGQLHAYLEGAGLELMANSDNVLRGGLTPKHVDVAELMKVLDFTAFTPVILKAAPISDGESRYQTPAREFVLSVLHVGAAGRYTSPSVRSAEILLCTNGEARIVETNGRQTVDISQGRSVIIPAAAASYHIEGTVTLYKAAVPLRNIKGV